jgi:CubicO group peptidase (beta-lactamase class C family)
MRLARVAALALTPVLFVASPRAAQAPSPAVAPKAAAKPAAAPSKDAAAIDHLFRVAVKPTEPGLAVVVVRGSQTLHRAAYGMANVELGVPLKPEHVFRIGSVTKQFTSAAIMILAEESKLAVSDPITKFLPDYPTQGKIITIEHLLTHTAGIQSYTDMPKWRGMWRQDMTLTALIDLFKNEPMQFDPGTRFQYNNSGYILLGAIIEKVTGKKYADVVQERIFTPLGMKDTRYDVSAEITPKRAAGYGRDGSRIVNAEYLSMTQPHAAGALMSTVDDLAKWEAAIAAGRVLKPESLAKSFTPFKMPSGNDTGYGYGWGISTYDGRLVQEHGGGIHGFRSYVLRIPSAGVYVAVLSNLAGPAPDPMALARKAAAIAVGKPLVNPAPVALTADQLEAYVGVYAAASGARHTISRDGTRLFEQSGGAEKTEIVSAGNDVFFVKDRFTRFTFQRDAADRYVRLDIDDWGPRPPATRETNPEAGRAPIKLDPAVVRAYQGEYELSPGFILAVTVEDDRVMTQATGQQKVEIFPSSPTEFFLKVVDAQITFVKDASGAVTHLVLHQGGRDMPAKKIR